MTSTPAPAPVQGALPARPLPPFADQLFGTLWPETGLVARPRLVGAALGVGLLAAVVLPFRDLGVGTFVVLLALTVTVAAADPRLRTPYHLVSATLCTLLGAMTFVRAAEWVVVLCLLAAAAVGVAALVGVRSFEGILAAGFALPLAPVRGMRWFGRSVAPAKASTSVWLPALRTAVVSAVLVLVFAALFGSADAVFARWVGTLVPDLSLDTLFVRGFVTVLVGGLTLAGVYVGLNPPQVERLALPAGSAVRRTFEWAVPVLLVVAVFAVFVAAQATVMFGGHAYLHRTTGLTYAAYVHQGFGQLTVVTLLTLVVVGAAVRKAPRATSRERLLTRAALGVLCLLTLVVVASALYRMHVYEEAYGYTRLRVLVRAFEGWLGLVVVMVLAAVVLLRGTWVPRAALLSGAAVLLVLALSNPDAGIARHNLDRPAGSGRLDTTYLEGLSADAAPVLAKAHLGTSCYAGAAPDATATSDPDATDDWLEWNLGRHRAPTLPCR